jgi:hypothetical protein
MQGLIDFATALADVIAVLLPAACYLAACACFTFAAWTFWRWSEPHRHGGHHFSSRPWVPFVSLIMSGVFATFPHFLTMANVSAGTGLVVGLTSYHATVGPDGSQVMGATPEDTVVNVVKLFQYFFQVFGAACVFLALWRWRAIVTGTMRGSPSACAVQFVFGVACINVLSITTGIAAYF